MALNLLRNSNNPHLGKTNSNSEISIPSSSDVTTTKINSFRERRMNGVNNSMIEIELDTNAKKEHDMMSKKSLVKFYGGMKGISSKGKSSNNRISSSSDDYCK